ncbi:MAG TPA: imidazole glycerol phosphate synthase subunit HisH [Bacteroidetes bacterium]|nr:imidazole glycerol phosphate synthase subunit HisH [Bacteroidota bacterium]HIL58308.1 imidazole glycerol phosphate synthase subunit HisH [Rhodothermales bacterium]
MIGILDTQAGNLTSVRAALDRLGLAHRTLWDVETDGLDAILVPGQGHFGSVMASLDARGWRDALLAWHGENRRLVGICVGQQILFEGSDEAPDAAGLGLLAGRAERLDFPKRPMVGWAPVEWTDPSLPAGDAYFVNSFAARQSADALAQTTYGERFVSAVRRRNTVAVQFHPEKSGAWGQQVLAQLLTSP